MDVKPASGTFVVPNEIFFENLLSVIRETGMVTFVVKGFSMFPFLRNGKDMVCLRQYEGGELKRGDVVLFLFNGHYILHRIIKKTDTPSGTRYMLCGDGNVSGVEYASRETVFGVMEKRITPSGKEWRCSSFSWRFLSCVWMRLRPVRRYLLAVARRVYS